MTSRLTRLKGGIIYDPENGINGVPGDIYFRDGKIVPPQEHADTEINIGGRIVMAGAIDMHTHIAGGKGTIARMMMGNVDTDYGPIPPDAPETGLRYAEMGYTACFEPAILPVNARQAHLEMADIPFLDTGGYVMLGNNDAFLKLLSSGASADMIRDYVACMLDITQCIGVKVVNPGGIHAFKFNLRKLDLDETEPQYNVTPRSVISALSTALDDLNVPHPLHVHTCNLGVPGNYRTTLDTVTASAGRRLHITHIQFHSYGTEGDRRFSSAAAEIVDAVSNNTNITMDVGQIMFGQTVTISGDTMSQFANCGHGHPKRWTVMDIECEAGCGVVPFRYRDKNFVHALQWAIGLEIFLLMKDPWRVFLTTDHPNGAPFISYPHLIRLLMDKSFRNDMLAHIHPEAAALSRLASLDREYTLNEIAIMTRAGPARLLGLSNKGHLSTGADADIVVYDPHPNPEIMFSTPLYVFKNGEKIVEKGGTLNTAVTKRTHTVKPEYDPSIKKWLTDYYDEHRSMRLADATIDNDEMSELIGSRIQIHPCTPR